MLHHASPGALPRGWLSRALARFTAPATPPDAKASRTGPLIALERPEGARDPRDYAAFAREGMMQNAIVYRAVRIGVRPRPACRSSSTTAPWRSRATRCSISSRAPQPRLHAR